MEMFLLNQIYQLKQQVKPTLFLPSFSVVEFDLTLVQLFLMNYSVLAHTILEKI